MENPNPKIYFHFSNRRILLDYYPQDTLPPNSVCVEGSSSVIFNREGWRALERLAQNSLIKTALKKECGRTKLIEIIGIKQDIEYLDSQNKISLTLEGTAVYS